MANTQVSTSKSESATIDTAPSTGGYWTEGVAFVRTGADIGSIIFTARGSGVAVPTLQFRDKGMDSEWTDFYNAGTAFEIGDVYEIVTQVTNLEWRAGVDEGDYTSGEVTVGLNWL